MFTGIIEESGQVQSFRSHESGWTLSVSARVALEGVRVGDSIAVNGCCLTVTRFGDGQLHFDVLNETRRLTNFSTLAPGSKVNLERSLPAGGRLGGHFVTGHIDGTGVIERLEPRGHDVILRIAAAAGAGRGLVRKGSIAVDGISLTVADVEEDSFTVWIIPHTLSATNLDQRRAGDLVNLEFDLIGKYVDKLLTRAS